MSNNKKITGLILTYNEEVNIVECIESLSFCNKVIIFDSISSDNTKELAIKYGAQVIERSFDNYASQRNAALKSVAPDCDWILMIDADERVSDNLRVEICDEISKNSAISMYLVRRKDYFLKKWIKRSSGYPTWFPRLFKSGEVTVDRDINEEYLTKGNKSYLKNHLYHYPFSKGLHYWIERHNKYSSMESTTLVEEFNKTIPWKFAFSKDPLLKRKFQKQFIYRLPFRAEVIFFIFYFLKGGFLDGKAGYYFCRLRYIYEIMIDTKIVESKNNKN